MKYFNIIIILLLICCCQNKTKPELNYSVSNIKNLLKISKKSILHQFKDDIQKKFIDLNYSDVKQGVAVRITENNLERGCIAFISGVSDIEEAVKIASINAAFFDDRFKPLMENELKNIKIEITIIGKFTKVENFNEIKTGRDSLYINNFVNHGFLQASIAVEEKYKAKDFLMALCRKAGLFENSYKEKRSKIFKAESLYYKMKFNDINTDK